MTWVAGRSLAGVLVVLGLAACGGGSSEGGGGGDAACAAVLHFEDRTYEGVGVAVSAQAGEELGDGVFPGCDDTGEGAPPGETVAVRAIEGTDPDVAVLAAGDVSTVWIAAGEDMPPELAALMAPPRCERSGRFVLAGAWHGISEHVARGLKTPYELEVYTDPGDEYGGANLQIRVTGRTKNPITRRDIRTSLWEGGRVTARVHCQKGRFVADRLQVHPG